MYTFGNVMSINIFSFHCKNITFKGFTLFRYVMLSVVISLGLGWFSQGKEEELTRHKQRTPLLPNPVCGVVKTITISKMMFLT